MRKSLLITCLLFTVTVVSAQKYTQFVAALNNSQGVRITQDDQSTRVLARIPTQASIYGFRICLYSSSDQNARSAASAIAAQARSEYPATAAKVTYETPVFRVIGGVYLSKTEATIALAAMKSSFSKAYIVNDRITLSELITTPGAEAEISSDESE